MSAHSRIPAETSLLIAIDVQPAFLRKLPSRDADLLLRRICWLSAVAQWLAIPQIVTAEDIPREGSIHPHLADCLPPDTSIYNKMTFDLSAEPAILAAVRATSRSTAVLVGLETDVCVAQSTLGLLEQGYQVAVVADATGSPGTDHRIGLERVRQAGGALVSVKSVFYEWLRTVERANQFWRECAQLDLPEGIR